MGKKLGCGCLVLIVLLAGLLFAFAQTELGQWLLAIVLLYGGVIVGGALIHDTQPGQVVELDKLAEPTSYSAGSLRFSYEDDDGVEHTEFRRVMYSTSKFRDLEVGDRIDVWVCKNDRTKVKLVGYGTYEPNTCADDPQGAGVEDDGAAAGDASDSGWDDRAPDGDPDGGFTDDWGVE